MRENFMVALFGEGEIEGSATNCDCTQQSNRICILVGQMA